MVREARADVPPTKVYLLPPESVVPGLPPLAGACHEQFRRAFAAQTGTSHALVADPGSADLILAAIQSGGYGLCLERLRRHRIYRDFAPRLVAYSPDANQFPAVRGLYPAAPRKWVRRGWALPAHYISSHIHRFGFSAGGPARDVPLSFVGSTRTHPVREALMRLKYPGAILIDSSPKTDRQAWWERPDAGAFVESFREVAERSVFVLCPRGLSPPSIRLFEVMEAGAVPIVVSDAAELPVGPDWASFSLRVRERDIPTIPALIDRNLGRATEMGMAARKAWEEFFSDAATAGTVVWWSRMLLAGPHRRPPDLRREEYLDLRRLRSKLRARSK